MSGVLHQAAAAGECACGKLRYTSRKRARAAARVKHPGMHLAAYRCGPYWHLGHLPQAAKCGLRARDECYRP